MRVFGLGKERIPELLWVAVVLLAALFASGGQPRAAGKRFFTQAATSASAESPTPRLHLSQD